MSIGGESWLRVDVEILRDFLARCRYRIGSFHRLSLAHSVNEKEYI